MRPSFGTGCWWSTRTRRLRSAPLPGAVAIIQPRELPFISYPYEWCFSQLREAALLVLELQRRALAAGMRLKDASAYNVQFDAGRPILIDSLSFEAADATEPWPAYRQFCEHFLAPLALAAYRDQRALLMLREFIDGIPLDYAARLLPGRTRLRPGLLAHVHVHARAQASQPGADASAPRPRKMTKLGQEALLDNLRRTVESLKPRRSGHWADYGRHTSYTEAAAASKAEIVERMAAASSAERPGTWGPTWAPTPGSSRATPVWWSRSIRTRAAWSITGSASRRRTGRTSCRW